MFISSVLAVSTVKSEIVDLIPSSLIIMTCSICLSGPVLLHESPRSIRIYNKHIKLRLLIFLLKLFFLLASATFCETRVDLTILYLFEERLLNKISVYLRHPLCMPGSISMEIPKYVIKFHFPANLSVPIQSSLR